MVHAVADVASVVKGRVVAAVDVVSVVVQFVVAVVFGEVGVF